MSDEQTATCLVFNHRDQPVELHLGDEVVVLPPLGQLELDEVRLGAPQVASLQQRRLIGIRRVEQPVGSAKPARAEKRERPAQDAASSRRRRRRTET